MTEYRLKDKGLVPTKGWRALQPETGFVVRGGTKQALAKNVREYREANALPIPNNFERMLGDQICAAMDDSERASRCRFLSEDDSKNAPNLRAWKKGKQDLKDFAIAVKETMAAHASGEPVHVGKEEAERRAAICAKCEFNVPIAPCVGCSQLAALYREVAVKQETQYSPLLKSCGVCGCFLSVKVWLAESVSDAISEKQGHQDRYPHWCWVKQRDPIDSP